MRYCGLGLGRNQMNTALLDRVVLPGDVLGNVEPDSALKLGPGLRMEQNSVVAVKAGKLRFRKPSIYWIDSNQRRVRTLIKVCIAFQPSFLHSTFQCAAST